MKKKLNISKKFFPVNEPVITRENIKDVTNSIKSGWISSDGKDVINFEKKFSKLLGRNMVSQYLMELLHWRWP